MNARIAYFGGEPLGAPTLQALIKAGYRPDLVVCNLDRPAGRGQQLTPPAVKVLAGTHEIPVWQPETLEPNAAELAGAWDLFIVVAYNKILPQWLIELPKHQTINVHPSLLPTLRGASPIRSAILRNEPSSVGVTIMQMDSQMDHGPILAQAAHPIDPSDWPPTGPDLDQQLIEHGAQLLIETVPRYLAGEIIPCEQDHDAATYCGRLSKDMAELTIDPHHLPKGEAAHEAYRTIQAFAGVGDAWFTHDGTRYKIKTAHLEGEQLVIDTVVPAGKPATTFTSLF
jgi:methionyl-tRNA formyltransferase